MAKSGVAVADPLFPARILFARIGWMSNYDGPQPGDERPRGGGANNKRNTGHEVFNFRDYGGHLYGFVRAKRWRINLARIEPNAAGQQKLDDVLVIFVARQNIVGWYRNATVYADTRCRVPSSVEKKMRRQLKQFGAEDYESWTCYVGFEAATKDATLLPLNERGRKRWEIPSNIKGGFGQYNIRYSYRADHVRVCPAWMKSGVKSVLDYNGPNLLADHHPELNPEEAAAVVEEKLQGFHSDPTIRRIIERHAMKGAEKELGDRGYCNIRNTSATKSYDFTCLKNGQQFFVEVKGTQTTGSSIILTKNEVEHAKANRGRCILVVVHSVRMNGERIIGAGVPVVREDWTLADRDLTAIQYLWRRQ